ncbi:MAG: uroporphyrinogen-III synthase [Alphaproteobacteria bacterium]
MSSVRLLVTRPEPESEETAARLRARGHDVLVAPLLRIELTPDAHIGAGPWSGIVMTSRNAARAIERHPCFSELCGLPVFAVGRRTAAAARSAGFSDVLSADGDADDLVRLIVARRATVVGRLLYLAGADRASDVTGALRAAGLPADTVAIYRAVAADEFPDAVRTALAAGELDGVLHLSRRSAESYLACARRDGLLVRALLPKHYCLSAQVAEPLIAAGARKIAVAPRPDEAALIELLTP